MSTCLHTWEKYSSHQGLGQIFVEQDKLMALQVVPVEEESVTVFTSGPEKQEYFASSWSGSSVGRWKEGKRFNSHQEIGKISAIPVKAPRRYRIRIYTNISALGLAPHTWSDTRLVLIRVMHLLTTHKPLSYTLNLLLRVLRLHNKCVYGSCTKHN